MFRIGLNEFEYNLDLIDPKYRFVKNSESYSLQYEKLFGWIDSLIHYEEDLINKSIKKEKI